MLIDVMPKTDFTAPNDFKRLRAVSCLAMTLLRIFQPFSEWMALPPRVFANYWIDGCVAIISLHPLIVRSCSWMIILNASRWMQQNKKQAQLTTDTKNRNCCEFWTIGQQTKNSGKKEVSKRKHFQSFFFKPGHKTLWNRTFFSAEKETRYFFSAETETRYFFSAEKKIRFFCRGKKLFAFLLLPCT